jgi:hypothetical protein
MKQTLKIVTVLAILTGAGILVVRKSNKRRQLKHVADNGYETAHDVLYPGEKAKHKKLHFGPVVPRSKN